MLWERKIHLEREMQQALDPTVGNLETEAMKREIHRMQLRFLVFVVVGSLFFWPNLIII